MDAPVTILDGMDIKSNRGNEGWMGGCIDEWMDRLMAKLIDGWMHGLLN